MHGPMKAWFAAKQKKKNCAEKAFKKYVGSQILWRILQPFTIEDFTDNSIFSTQDMQCCWLFKNAKTSHILGWKYRIIQKICYTAVVQSCNIRHNIWDLGLKISDHSENLLYSCSTKLQYSSQYLGLFALHYHGALHAYGMRAWYHGHMVQYRTMVRLYHGTVVRLYHGTVPCMVRVGRYCTSRALEVPWDHGTTTVLYENAQCDTVRSYKNRTY